MYLHFQIKMCENKSEGFINQTLDQEFTLTPDPINFKYIGPTSGYSYIRWLI